MNTVIGIDVGGSTTKIVGFAPNGDLIQPMNVTAADPLTSLYGAFGKFTAANGLELGQIEKIMLTGVGSSYINQPMVCPARACRSFRASDWADCFCPV